MSEKSQVVPNGRHRGEDAATAVNSKAGEKGIPLEKEKQDEIIHDIKRMYEPEWDQVNELADKRLSELIVQAQKEYKVKKERNQDVSRLEGKYLAIYNDYEQRAKTQVDGIVSNMQKEVIEKELQTNIGDKYLEMYRILKEKRIEKVASELKKLS